jgi:hypothetical protein
MSLPLALQKFAAKLCWYYWQHVITKYEATFNCKMFIPSLIKSVKTFQFWTKLNKTNGHFTGRLTSFIRVSWAKFTRYSLQIKCSEQKLHRKMKDALYAQYALSINLTISRIIKKQECYGMFPKFDIQLNSGLMDTR